MKLRYRIPVIGRVLLWWNLREMKARGKSLTRLGQSLGYYRTGRERLPWLGDRWFRERINTGLNAWKTPGAIRPAGVVDLGEERKRWRV